VDEKHFFSIIFFQLPNQLARLLCNPGYVRICSVSGTINFASSQFDEEQDIDGLMPDRLNREEITSKDLIFVMPQEATPRACRPLRYRRDSMSLEGISNRWNTKPVTDFE
jgi:hypothetical protein